ncbi:hypothetical protein [Tessaracoccus caeni]|uniref:hypothetical protein n=1 Tax=Tessaracoccus caeni TaxID=3031239 RepID=UPI0023DC3638|nr:hypothetical protein [Tessaracoccus caeni]MDF1489236.1 hypothetical protein [Tessaracoccus caeni]
MTKEIQTLPPIEVLSRATPTSPRTGEPPRTAELWVSSILLHLASAASAGAYAWHWWQAAHPDSYATSARMIAWLEPDPGKWLSLLIEGLLALALVLAAGACSVVGLQTWNGWRLARKVSPLAVLLTGLFALALNQWALIGVGLAVVGVALLWLPGVTRYFVRWDELRSVKADGYRRPDSIYYGRLPRFR